MIVCLKPNRYRHMRECGHLGHMVTDHGRPYCRIMKSTSSTGRNNIEMKATTGNVWCGVAGRNRRNLRRYLRFPNSLNYYDQQAKARSLDTGSLVSPP